MLTLKEKMKDLRNNLDLPLVLFEYKGVRFEQEDIKEIKEQKHIFSFEPDIQLNPRISNERVIEINAQNAAATEAQNSIIH